MSVGLAATVYAVIVAFVSSVMIYYFRVIRPKDEEQFK